MALGSAIVFAGAGRVGAAGLVASEGGANKGFVGDAGAVGGATKGFVAAGAARPGIGEPVLSLMVGAPVLGAVLSLIVGADAGRTMGPAVLRGMVGAGAGAPPGAVGAGGRARFTGGVGGLGAAGADATAGEVGGATGTVADGMAGASLARNVTRTVSFFKGMAAVCFLGTYWSSLMGLILCEDTKPKNDSDVKRGISSLQSFFQKKRDAVARAHYDAPARCPSEVNWPASRLAPLSLIEREANEGFSGIAPLVL